MVGTVEVDWVVTFLISLSAGSLLLLIQWAIPRIWRSNRVARLRARRAASREHPYPHGPLWWRHEYKIGDAVHEISMLVRPPTLDSSSKIWRYDDPQFLPLFAATYIREWSLPIPVPKLDGNGVLSSKEIERWRALPLTLAKPLKAAVDVVLYGWERWGIQIVDRYDSPRDAAEQSGPDGSGWPKAPTSP